MKTLEDVKSYWDNRPCNLKHSDKPVGTKEFFEEVSERKYFVEYHIPSFADFGHWGHTNKNRVLEIGCGIGTDTESFAQAGAQVTAVDLSRTSIALAKQRMQASQLSVSFYQANAEDLSKYVPIPEVKYDLVYSFGVIHHTPHPEKVLEEIKKYMGPESTLKIMVYHKVSWKVLWILLKYGKGAFWKLNELIAKYSEAQTGCPVTYTYTKKSVRKLLKDFDISEMRVEHIFPYKIEDYKNYQYKKVWYFRFLPRIIFKALEKKFGWHLCITATLKS